MEKKSIGDPSSGLGAVIDAVEGLDEHFSVCLYRILRGGINADRELSEPVKYALLDMLMNVANRHTHKPGEENNE